MTTAPYGAHAELVCFADNDLFEQKQLFVHICVKFQSSPTAPSDNRKGQIDVLSN